MPILNNEELLPLRVVAVNDAAKGVILSDVRLPLVEPFQRKSFDVRTGEMRMGTIKGYRVVIMKRDEPGLPLGLLYGFREAGGICLAIVEDIEFDA